MRIARIARLRHAHAMETEDLRLFTGWRGGGKIQVDVCVIAQ